VTAERTDSIHGTRLTSDIWRELRVAVRSLARSRGFTAATTGTIALAVAAGCAVF
jgi:hypothetical protein